MKIALLTDGIYPYVIGGMQKHSFYLAKYFAMHKIEVDLYHTAIDLYEADKLNCFTEEEKTFIHSSIIPFPKLDKFPGHYIREMYTYSASIALELKRRPVDFVYVQGLCGMKLLENKSDFKAPVGINFHGLEMFQKTADMRSKIEQYIFRKPVLRSLKNADTVFSLGEKLTNLLIDKGVSRDKIKQIAIGIDPTWLKTEKILPHSKITFIFVGRYERRKGIEELAKALKGISDKNFEFHFIGGIPEQKKIISSNIHYWGNLSDISKIKELLRKSDVLVCPSYSEGMPTVILEAMASGLAIIASNVGAISEQVDGNNGLLISPGNINELKKALLTYIDISIDTLIMMKQHSIERIEQRFLWDTIILKTIEEIQLVVKH